MPMLLTSAPHLTKLRIPSIRANLLTSSLLQGLPDQLPLSFNLETIEAPSTSVHIKDLLWIAKHCPKLRVLRIAQLKSDTASSYDSSDGDEIASSSIKRLTLLHQDTPVNEIQHLAPFFRSLNTLHITFDTFHVDHRAAQRFADSLLTCPRLRRVQIIYSINELEWPRNCLLVPQSIFNLKHLSELVLNGFAWGPTSGEASNNQPFLSDDECNPQYAKLLKHCPQLHPNFICTFPPRIAC